MLSSMAGPAQDTFRDYTNIEAASATLNNVSSSKSSSSSSSPGPFSPVSNSPHFHNNITTPQKSKTMEEVWKDIASLHDHPSSNPHHNPNFILQDFFARPTRIVSGTTTTTTSSNLYGFSVPPTPPPPPPPPPPPATVLSLNSSCPVFDFLASSDPVIESRNYHLPTNPISNVSSFNSSFEGLDSASGLPSFGKKRVQESDTTSCDRRHKRMLKNRESAARSRARKQAYTNELELEVRQLAEENERLKREQGELYLAAAAAAQLPKKHTLHRTSTAPF